MNRLCVAPAVGALLLVSGTCRADSIDIAGADRPKPIAFWAAANAQHGITRSGAVNRRGYVAADPKVLPIGSQIRISGAGPYSGVYTVADTGAKVRGRSLDVYMKTPAECRRFGRKKVQVEILAIGGGKLAPVHMAALR